MISDIIVKNNIFITRHVLILYAYSRVVLFQRGPAGALVILTLCRSYALRSFSDFTTKHHRMFFTRAATVAIAAIIIGHPDESSGDIRDVIPFFADPLL